MVRLGNKLFDHWYIFSSICILQQYSHILAPIFSGSCFASDINDYLLRRVFLETPGIEQSRYLRMHAPSSAFGPLYGIYFAKSDTSAGKVHAPCSFHNFTPCSLLLSVFCPLLLFHPFLFSFFIFLCSLLLFNYSSCSRIFFFLHAPF